MQAMPKDEKKIGRISAFMRGLSEANPEEKPRIVTRYSNTLVAITPINMFYVEAYRDDTPLSVDAIKSQANRFVNVFRKGLKHHEVPKHDHPFFAPLHVEHCHPPRSVDTVKRIVDAIKRKEQAEATFWIHFKTQFLCIRYGAVRDAEGDYLGVLETPQDVTGVRELEGERRLLAWDEEEAA